VIRCNLGFNVAGGGHCVLWGRRKEEEEVEEIGLGEREKQGTKERERSGENEVFS